MKMAKLIVIKGPPCAGKSTMVQKRLSDKDVVFDWDLVQRAITHLDIHDHNENAKHIIAGFRKIFINDSQTNKGFENFYLLTCNMTDSLNRQLENCDYDIEEVEATEEECLNRLEKDDSRPNKEIFKQRIHDYFEQHSSKEEVRKMSKETRVGNIIEVRSNDDNEMVIEGYALKFDTWSENLGGFKETISRRALENTDLSDVRCLVDHIPSQIIGRTKSGTLQLETDDVGLKYRCKLPNTTFARDLYENMRVGNINQCSFGFMLDDKGDEMRFDEQENIYKRTLTAIRKLTDVSVVTYPAYKDTDVKPALRSIESIKKEQRKKELELRLKKHSILNKIW